MRSFEVPKLLILGGSDKGAVYDEVIQVAKQTGTTILSIGQTGVAIYAACQAAGVPVYREEGLMREVVQTAAKLSHKGGVVLLSPASASFDQYKNYADRGDQFIASVEEL
jgi:UDP-N-acetylmuramoylalanine--D-glutamate ligase